VDDRAFDFPHTRRVSACAENRQKNRKLATIPYSGAVRAIAAKRRVRGGRAGSTQLFFSPAAASGVCCKMPTQGCFRTFYSCAIGGFASAIEQQATPDLGIRRARVET
jgi:hypothetical protein